MRKKTIRSYQSEGEFFDPEDFRRDSIDIFEPDSRHSVVLYDAEGNLLLLDPPRKIGFI